MTIHYEDFEPEDVSDEPPATEPDDEMERAVREHEYLTRHGAYPNPVQEQERYRQAMRAYDVEREKYRRGERDTLPPRPIPPHTPGWRGA